MKINDPKNLDSGSNFILTRLEGEAAFHQIRVEWEELWRQSTEATQFQRWEWQYLYYKNLLPKTAPQILVARDSSGCCVALAAFCKVSDPISGLKKIAFLGDLSADYHMILSRPNLPITLGFQIFDQLFELSKPPFSYVDLSNIPQDSWTQAVVSAYFQDVSFPPGLLIRKETQTFAVPLPGDLEVYLRQLGSRSRKDFGYDRRRLGREFSIKWQIFAGGDGLKKCLADIEAIDRARWGEDSRYCDPNWRTFLVSLSEAQAQAGIYLAFVLYLDGKPSAYVTGVVVQNSYKAESIGYDPSIAGHLSIGKTTNFYAIEACIQRNLSEFDLSRGSEVYKKWLGGKAHKNFHIRLYSNRLSRGLDAIMRVSLEFLRRQTWLRRLYQRFVRGTVQ